MREDVAWQRDLARQRDQELQALRARESKTAVEIKGLRALATRLGEQMSSEASSAKKDLDYADSLARLRDAELQELRARVGIAATGCCAAMCGTPSWSSESGELVALPNCEHCLHSDCLLQLLTPYCPQCRHSVAKSPEAKTHLAINSDFIIREREREAEAEARREAAREAKGFFYPKIAKLFSLF